MSTAARYWLLLVPCYTLTYGFISVLLCQTIDLRLEVVAQCLLVPFVQAWGLAWVEGAFSLKDCLRAVTQMALRPLVIILWCFQALLLFLYLAIPAAPNITVLIARTAGIEALLAALIILARLLPRADLRTWTHLLPFLILTMALGSNGIVPWLNLAPTWLPQGWPYLLRQALVLGATVISLILFTGRAQRGLSPQSPLPAFILGCMHPFTMAAATAIVMNGYLFAFLADPWQQITVISISLAAALFLTAGLCLPGPEKSKHKRPFYTPQDPKGPMGLLTTWSSLAICSLASLFMLRLLFFPNREWSVRTLLSLLLVPLILAAWLRWARGLYLNRRSLFRFTRYQALLVVLACLEAGLAGYMAFSEGLWELRWFQCLASVWIGLKLLILDALRFRPHPTHFSISQALKVVERLKPERTLFVHMTHDVDHHTTNAMLPEGVELAYDGMVVEI